MKRLTETKQRNKLIAEEAAAWAVRLDGGDLSAKENEALAQWLKESPRHVEELLLAGAFWAATDKVDAEGRLSVESLLANAGNVVSLASPPKAQSTTRHGLRAWKKAFAGLAVAATLVLALLFGLPGGFYTGAPPHPGQLYTTETGEQRSFTLADGSVIHINTQSSLRVRYTGSVRAIDLLRGEAMFQVAHEPGRPFRVFVEGSWVEALGTEFNLYRRAEQTQVTVVTGKVLVRQEKDLPQDRGNTPWRALLNPTSNPAASHQDGVLLVAGQETRVALNGNVGQVYQADIDKALSWRRRVLVFRNDPLATVVAEFNRYNRVQIHLADAALAATPMKAALSVDNPESLLALIVAMDNRVVVDRTRKTEIVVRRQKAGAEF